MTIDIVPNLSIAHKIFSSYIYFCSLVRPCYPPLEPHNFFKHPELLK